MEPHSNPGLSPGPMQPTTRPRGSTSISTHTTTRSGAERRRSLTLCLGKYLENIKDDAVYNADNPTVHRFRFPLTLNCSSPCGHPQSPSSPPSQLPIPSNGTVLPKLGPCSLRHLTLTLVLQKQICPQLFNCVTSSDPSGSF